MERNRIIITVLPGFLIFLLTTLSCTMWNHRDWQQLQDRNFFFNSFTYTHNGGSKVLAYSRMKEAPMRRILDLAEKKYSISIDSTEYDNFLVSGSPSLIKASGILMEKDFVWKGSKTGRNTVNMVLVVALDDLEFIGYNYQFILTTNGKTRAFAQGTVKKKEMVYPHLAKQLGADSASLSAIALTSDVALKNQSSSGPADSNSAPSYKSRQWAVEGKIKEQIDSYSRKLTPEDRKQFKDDMERFINSSIKQHFPAFPSPDTPYNIQRIGHARHRI